MMILSLVRNYIPSYKQVIAGNWNIADCVVRAYDVEGMAMGTVAAGRIGLAVLKRMKPFDCELHYTGMSVGTSGYVGREETIVFYPTSLQYSLCSQTGTDFLRKSKKN